ncbi:MAG: GTPase Era [Bryobacteraceae bacterium]|nr:GTPase Era [Bryobacteraceae bacterium]
MPENKHRSGLVSILGRPNAGKSTLLNAFVGQKVAIVSNKPQTTRTAIQGVVTLDNAQIVFVDTPGIHKTDSLMNKRMMEDVRTALEDRDVLLFVHDASHGFGESDEHAIALLKRVETPAIAVLNKADLLSDKVLMLPRIERLRKCHEFAAFVPISASRADGLDVLLAEIVKHLPEGPRYFPPDHVTDQPERFLAAELIREQALRKTRQEVPHSVAVLIEGWEEEPKITRIAATIYVERQGQKAILIGAKGAMLKEIGTEARQEIESMLGQKVFLKLFVKVKENWREDPQFLAESDWRSLSGG